MVADCYLWILRMDGSVLFIDGITDSKPQIEESTSVLSLEI